MPHRALDPRLIGLSDLGATDEERLITQIDKTIELAAGLLEDMELSETSIALRYALLQLRFETSRQ
ncbi:hypothetical protein [Blastochloris tepida]|uniref:Uncharacterized protein n=1 Tax=Blastochloris tepida TaxID=2233851 RepID=A0A348G3M6_9HYPH|nr:hypothetical protein [Blastochloris tepida]BBF94159.1 hypothetical protein BLTE_28440 [Blastochloris tepida]